MLPTTKKACKVSAKRPRKSLEQLKREYYANKKSGKEMMALRIEMRIHSMMEKEYGIEEAKLFDIRDEEAEKMEDILRGKNLSEEAYDKLYRQIWDTADRKYEASLKELKKDIDRKHYINIR